jgi:hypothetical protein
MSKKFINLKKLNFSFQQKYPWEEKSEAPSKVQYWITIQNNYKKDSLGYELVLLFTNFSSRLFQEFIFNNYISAKWQNINIHPSEAVKELTQFIRSSPKTNTDIIVYRGLSNRGANFLGINSNKYIITEKGFVSTSFNIKHAFSYVRLRNLLNKRKYDSCCLLRILVPKGTNCVYEPYEDQVLFAPNTSFKIINKKKILFGEKNRFPLTMIYCELINDNIH